MKETTASRLRELGWHTVKTLIDTLLIGIAAGVIVIVAQVNLEAMNEDQRRQADAQAEVAEVVDTFSEQLMAISFELQDTYYDEYHDVYYIALGDDKLYEIYTAEKSALRDLTTKRDLNQNAFAPYHEEISQCEAEVKGFLGFIEEVRDEGFAGEPDEYADRFFGYQDRIIESCKALSNHCSEVRYGAVAE